MALQIGKLNSLFFSLFNVDIIRLQLRSLNEIQEDGPMFSVDLLSK